MGERPVKLNEEKRARAEDKALFCWKKYMKKYTTGP